MPCLREWTTCLGSAVTSRRRRINWVEQLSVPLGLAKRGKRSGVPPAATTAAFAASKASPKSGTFRREALVFSDRLACGAILRCGMGWLRFTSSSRRPRTSPRRQPALGDRPIDDAAHCGLLSLRKTARQLGISKDVGKLVADARSPAGQIVLGSFNGRVDQITAAHLCPNLSRLLWGRHDQARDIHAG